MSWLGSFRRAGLVTGLPDEQRLARLEWRRAREAEGIRARWDEIPAERLVHGRHWLEDTQTGNLYREFAGDPNYAEQVCAYYLRDGVPTMLEPADPPSRAALEERQAAKEQRRTDKAAAAKERYAALREGASR